MAKIAIASQGETLDSLVDPRFGRCRLFLIVDSETEEFKILKNSADNLARGAGISAAQLVVNQGVKVAMAGNFGPKAVGVLSQSGIRIISVSGKSAKQAIEDYQAGKLKPVKPSQVPFGRGGGFGRGRGFGRGG